jgi:hypothetical protein
VSWLLNLFAPILWYLGIPLSQRYQLYFLGAGVSVVDNPTKNRTEITISGAPTSGALGSETLSLGTQTPPQFQESASPTITTTDASVAPLWSYTYPAAKLTVIEVQVFAWLATSTTAFYYNNTFAISAVRIGTAGPVNPIYGFSNNYSNASPPAPFAAAGSPGGLQAATSGSTITLSAQGLAIGSVSAWAAGAFTKGALVTKGGYLYAVISIAGTGTSTSGPAGTGTTVDNPGADQVEWDCIGPTTAGIPIMWGPGLTTVYTT